jgi:uncharacterized alkaline shock family protein YloU
VSYVLHEERGTVTVTAAALTQLVAGAADAVEGARVRRGRRNLDVLIENGKARVDVALIADFGAVLPDVAREVQERVAAALAAMCRVEVTGVDVSVEEVE